MIPEEIKDATFEITQKELDVKLDDVRKAAVTETELKFTKEALKKADEQKAASSITVKENAYPHKLGALMNYLAEVKTMEMRGEKNAFDSVLKGAYKDHPAASFIDGINAKANVSNDTAAGGWSISPTISMLFTEPLSYESVVRRAGANIMPLVGDALLNMSEGSVSSFWTGEAANITMSNPDGTATTTHAKTLACLSTASNKLIRLSAISWDAQIEKRMIESMAEMEAATALRGVLSSTAPAGISNIMLAGNKVAMTTLGAIPGVTMGDDILALMAKVETQLKANAMRKPAIFMHPRTWTAMYKQTYPTTGLRIFADDLKAGKLFDIPVYKTPAIPINLGTGTNESEIYLIDMDTVFIGVGNDFRFEIFPNGSFHDGSVAVSGISSDITVFRALMDTCYAMTRTGAAAMLTGVTWS